MRTLRYLDVSIDGAPDTWSGKLRDDRGNALTAAGGAGLHGITVQVPPNSHPPTDPLPFQPHHSLKHPASCIPPSRHAWR